MFAQIDYKWLLYTQKSSYFLTKYGKSSNNSFANGMFGISDYFS